MPEKRFEKELQEDMAGLGFRPSDEVWLHVAAALRRKKRRRAAYYFLTILGITVLGFGGYSVFLEKDIQQDGIAHVSKKQGPYPTKEVNSQTSTGIAQSEGPSNPGTSGTVSSSANKADNQQSTAGARMAGKHFSANNTTPIEREKRAGINGLQVRVPGSNTQLQNRKTNSDVNFSPEALITTGRSSGSPVDKDVQFTDKKSFVAPPAAEMIKKQTLVEKNNFTDQPDIAGAIAATEFPLKGSLSNKKKWEIGLVFGAGSNQQTDELPRLVKARMDNSPLYSNAPQTGGTAVNPIILPSDVRAGIALKIGVTAAYPLTDKSKVSAGVQYSFMSTRMRVGQFDNSTVNFDAINAQPVVTNVIYRGPQQRSFTNKYHSIQLPLAYELQLNRNKTARLSWSVGIVPGYLISSNALLYDTAFSGIYYKNNDGLKRFRLGATTGLHIAFGKPGKLQWSIGPDFYLDLRSMTKPSFGTRQYFMNAGISARIFMPTNRK